MSTPSPFTVTKDGLSYRVEFDVHYLSDEEVETVSRYVAELEAENAELRELVRDMAAVIWTYDYTSDDDCPPALPLFEDRLRELGVEV